MSGNKGVIEFKFSYLENPVFPIWLSWFSDFSFLVCYLFSRKDHVYKMYSSTDVMKIRRLFFLKNFMVSKPVL